MEKTIIYIIIIILAVIVGVIIYLTRPKSSNNVNLMSIQDYTNTLKPYKPEWPVLKPIGKSTGSVDTNTINGIRNYLSYLYPAFDATTKISDNDLYDLYNSLTLYYNPESTADPVFGNTQGWMAAPFNDKTSDYSTPFISGGDNGNDDGTCYSDPGKCNTACTALCQPWCEPGFCSKAIKLPMVPVGYFAEFHRWFYEMWLEDDVMSIGQTYPIKSKIAEKPTGLGHTGQWAVKYVDEDPSKMVQDDVVLKRSIRDPQTMKYASSMDMWNSFLGRGITFLSGNTLHRCWWAPNGAPGQVKNTLMPGNIISPIDCFTLSSPGLDYGMISVKTGKIIKMSDCVNDINMFLEYLDMRGDIPTINWRPTSDIIANRFNTPGYFWSGYKETSSTSGGTGAPAEYYIEFNRTDIGTNFAFTGNWIDIFEGAGMFYKYSKTLIAPNKCGAVLKLCFIMANNKSKDTDIDNYDTKVPKEQRSRYALLRKILGVDYIYSSDPKFHAPKIYEKGTYIDSLGVTQGMCMGVSLPGKTGKVVLDPTDPESGAQLWKDAYEAQNKSDESMIFLGLIWLLCNSVAHSPPNDTSYVSETNPSYGFSSQTFSFFTQWAKAKSLNIRDPVDLYKACKVFLMTCAMGSGGDSAMENYVVNQWQNTTVFDLLMFTMGFSLDYDIIQLTLDITENNLWTRESLAMKIPDELVPAQKTQLYSNGPKGGSFLVLCEQFGTGWDLYNPKFTDNMIDYKKSSNPMPIYNNPETDTSKWVGWTNADKSQTIIGPPGSPNRGAVVTYVNDAFKIKAKIVTNSVFNDLLFNNYFQNDIFTIRNPINLLTDPGFKTTNYMNYMTSQISPGGSSSTYGPTVYGRKLKDTTKLTYDSDGHATIAWTDFDTNFPDFKNPNGIPIKRIAQRGYGDWLAFFAKGTQTQDWGRQAAGYAF